MLIGKVTLVVAVASLIYDLDRIKIYSDINLIVYIRHYDIYIYIYEVIEKIY